MELQQPLQQGSIPQAPGVQPGVSAQPIPDLNKVNPQPQPSQPQPTPQPQMSQQTQPQPISQTQSSIIKLVATQAPIANPVQMQTNPVVPTQARQIPAQQDDITLGITPNMMAEEVSVVAQKDGRYNNKVETGKLFTADELPETAPDLSPMHTRVDQYSESQQEVFRNNRQRRLVVMLTSLVTLIIIGSAVFGYLFWKNSFFAVEKYDGLGFTMTVPKGYKETDNFPFVGFSEPTGKQQEKSQIFVMAQPYSKELTPEEFDAAIKGATEDKLKSLIGSQKSAEDVSFSNIAITTEKSSNQLIYKGTAEMNWKGTNAGKLYFKYDLNRNSTIIVMVGANNTDPKLAKNAEKIINSVKLSPNN